MTGRWKLTAAVLAATAGLIVFTGWPADAAAPKTPVVLWAVVNVDGTLARSSGAVSSGQHGANGTYIVTFNRDISSCAFAATAGEAGTFGADDAITFGVGTDAGSPSAVDLVEYDAILAQDSFSSGFHLIVTC